MQGQLYFFTISRSFPALQKDANFYHATERRVLANVLPQKLQKAQLCIQISKVFEVEFVRGETPTLRLEQGIRFLEEAASTSTFAMSINKCSLQTGCTHEFSPQPHF
jgi:hypothetical protein